MPEPMDDTPLPASPDDFPEDRRPSKSQVKRDMHALLDLGRELIALPPAKLARLPLDEPLREAIALAQRIHSNEGRRRQVHYVGKQQKVFDGIVKNLKFFGADGQVLCTELNKAISLGLKDMKQDMFSALVCK